ncbi:hypothetical protein FIBSPDRAFT_961537 [Athelia psychrophila]|uniref:Uncharacterized protein n=1 Tax=Athelia psychrophila TaxID=1759441 RepID=A0A166B334_9AGAM|nr:hypothetical protein FIBSPDRAFT_961537 [Fibularhizoctonia sp. CBS 109695]
MTQPLFDLRDIPDLTNASRHLIHPSFLPTHSRKHVCWRSLPASPYSPGNHLPTAVAFELARLVRPALLMRLLHLHKRVETRFVPSRVYALRGRPICLRLNAQRSLEFRLPLQNPPPLLAFPTVLDLPLTRFAPPVYNARYVDGLRLWMTRECAVEGG